MNPEMGLNPNPNELEAKKFALIMQMMQKQLDDRIREMKKGKKKKSKKCQLQEGTTNNEEASNALGVREQGENDQMSVSLKTPKLELSLDNQKVEPVPKKFASCLLLKPVEASVVQGLKLKPVDPSEVAHLVRKRRVISEPEAITNLTKGNQDCLNDSVLDDILRGSEELAEVTDPGRDSKPLIVEERECDKCFKQFSKRGNLFIHKKREDCLQILCKAEHNHDFKIIKFASADEALAFGKSRGKPHVKWSRKTPLSDGHIVRSTCREIGCSAHWSIKETRRPSGKVDHVFRGCLAHGLNCRLQESNVQVVKPKPERKLRASYTLRKVFPDWESAMQNFHDTDQDLIFSLKRVKRDSLGNICRKHFTCHRRGKPMLRPGSEYISKKIGCTASCLMRMTSKGIEYAGDFKHNHEELEGVRRRGVPPTVVEKRRVCDICGVLRRDSDALSRHVEVVHKKLRTFLCSDCPYVASSNGNLKKHAKNIHKRIIPCKCRKCPYKTEFVIDLRKHVQICHQNRKKKPSGGAEETRELCIQELDNIRAKLFSGEIDKTTLEDFSNLIAKMKDASQEIGQK